MSKLNYVDWDVLDIGGHYEFSPQEMIDIDYLNLTNFLLRGEGAVYTFNCDPSIPKGTTITVRNNEFGLDEGYYFGIQIILNPDSTAKRASYSFFFKDQIESFIFNGSFWMCNSPEPVPVVEVSFIDEETIATGYLDIRDFNDDSKKILFSNVDMNDFDPSILFSVDDTTGKSYGRFFRDGSAQTLQEDTFQSHTHLSNHHQHTYGPSIPVPFHLRTIMSYIKEFKRLDHKGLNSNLFSNILLSALMKHKKEILDTLKNTDSSISFEDILKLIRSNTEKRNYMSDLESFLKKTENMENLDLSPLLSVELKDLNESNLRSMLLEVINLNKINLNIFSDVINTFCICGKDCLNGFLDDHKCDCSKLCPCKINGDSLCLCEQLLNSIINIILTEITAIISQVGLMFFHTLALADTTAAFWYKGDVPVALPFYQISTADTANFWVWNWNDCTDISKWGIIAGNKNVTQLKDISSSDIHPEKILNNMFHIYKTSKATVKLQANEGLTETRPDNIQGRYIIKCF